MPRLKYSSAVEGASVDGDGGASAGVDGGVVGRREALRPVGSGQVETYYAVYASKVWRYLYLG
jgi:hypothetical protein